MSVCLAVCEAAAPVTVERGERAAEDGWGWQPGLANLVAVLEPRLPLCPQMSSPGFCSQAGGQSNLLNVANNCASRLQEYQKQQ